ncbi:hypothetical protein GCM10028785_13000 [Hydrogenophaga soli]
MVLPELLGATVLGLICRFNAAAVVAWKVTGNVAETESDSTCAVIVADPAVVELMLTVATPLASVMAVPADIVPRVVENVTVLPGTPTPALRYVTVTAVLAPTLMALLAVGAVIEKLTADTVTAKDDVAPKPVTFSVSLPAVTGV